MGTTWADEVDEMVSELDAYLSDVADAGTLPEVTSALSGLSDSVSRWQEILKWQH